MYPVQSLSELFHSHIQLHLFCSCRRQPFLSISDLWDVWLVPFSFKQRLISQTARVLSISSHFRNPCGMGLADISDQRTSFPTNFVRNLIYLCKRPRVDIQTRRPKNLLSQRSPIALYSNAPLVVKAATGLEITVIQAVNEQNVSPQKKQWLYIHFLAINLLSTPEYRTTVYSHATPGRTPPQCPFSFIQSQH